MVAGIGCLSWRRPPRKTSSSGNSLNKGKICCKFHNTNPGTVCGKAVTKEQRPSTAPCLADIKILEGLWLLFGNGLLEEVGDMDLDDDDEEEDEVLDSESLKSDMMEGKLSGLRNWQ